MPEPEEKRESKSKNIILIKDRNPPQKKDTFGKFEKGISERRGEAFKGRKITELKFIARIVSNGNEAVNKIIDVIEEIKCITYHIYIGTTGEIKKETPKEITKGYEKKCQYIVYENENIIYSCILEKNEYNLFPFPETGNNWGRYGGRDKGGDNWIEEKTCAALLGFFFSLPKYNFKDTLYYNDISANDKRNIGHKTHRGGQDIDIRYPGSHNGSQVFWKEAMKKYKNEEEFVKVLENILYVSTLWGFNTNYAYKSNIKHTKGTATSVHQDHFHIGLR